MLEQVLCKIEDVSRFGAGWLKNLTRIDFGWFQSNRGQSTHQALITHSGLDPFKVKVVGEQARKMAP